VEIGQYGFIPGTPPAVELHPLTSVAAWRHSREAKDANSTMKFWKTLKGCFSEEVWAKIRPLSERRQAAAAGQS
jgi:protein-disulfide isomerase